MKDNKHQLIYRDTDFPAVERGNLRVLQVNLGYLCNQSCSHCHVNAGPHRTELMDKSGVDTVLAFLEHHRVELLDLTGGAPELNPHFRYLVKQARDLGVCVMDRCNLTVLQVPGQSDLAEFLKDHQVQVTASLPCYLEDNVDKQRGQGVFALSIQGLKALNQLGYGKTPELALNLVYNPQGANLPPSQVALEAAYRSYLFETHQIEFTQLLTLANMPIARFAATLVAKGEFERYLDLLKDNFNPDTLSGLMCRDTLSVDWQGYLYDCDFNQMLSLPLGCATENRPHLSQFMQWRSLGQPIRVADHCFGCTAGQGSSCGGAITE